MSMLCVTMMIVSPSWRFKSRNRRTTSPPASASRLPVGSSAKQNTRPIDERPRDGCALHFAAGQLARPMVQTPAQADAVEQFDGPVFDLPAMRHPTQYGPSDHLRHEDVFQGGEFGQQVVKLENEAECLVAQQVASLRRQVVDALAVEKDFAFVGPVEDAEQVQQRTLAGAGGADDAEEFALLYFQVEAAQHFRLDGVLAIGLLQRRPPTTPARLLAWVVSPYCLFPTSRERKRAVIPCGRLCSRLVNGLFAYSYRSARTGWSSAARSAGKMLNSTAIPTAPMLIKITVNGCKSVGISLK